MFMTSLRYVCDVTAMPHNGRFLVLMCMHHDHRLLHHFDNISEIHGHLQRFVPADWSLLLLRPVLVLCRCVHLHHVGDGDGGRGGHDWAGRLHGQLHPSLHLLALEGLRGVCDVTEPSGTQTHTADCWPCIHTPHMNPHITPDIRTLMLHLTYEPSYYT